MSFKDTFTKEDSKSSLLEYDDSAFFYFASTLLLSFLLPYTYWLCSRKVWNRRRHDVHRLPTGEVLKRCGCSLCAEKRVKLKKEVPLLKRLSHSWIHVTVLALGWSLLILLCLTSLTSMKSMATFDPFEVLQIPMEATETQIKKAFRKMSLKYHPDKNKNDPTSAAKFLLISKAYHTLTDEGAKKNFEKYGNPEGPGMMKVGIGLPTFLVQENSQTFILAIFFMFLLIVVPAGFILYYQHIREFSPSGMRLDTLRYFSAFMREQTQPPQMLAFIASSAECRSLPYRPKDVECLQKVKSKIKFPPEQAFRVPISHPAVQKNLILLLAYMQRKSDLLNEDLSADLVQLLRYAHPMTKSLIDIAVFNNWHPSIHAVLGVRRALLQAVDIGEPPLLQLPHLDSAKSREVLKILSVHKPANFKSVTRCVIDHASSHFSKNEVADLEAIWSHIPGAKIDVSIAVEDEEEIVVGDIATCNIKVEREALKEGEAQGASHAPYYPEHKYEEWFFFITEKDTGQVLGFQSSKSMSRVFEVDIPFPVRQAGNRSVVVVGLCDSYFGCDAHVVTSYTVLNEGDVKRKFFVHPEDVALDNAPTLFQQMIGTLEQDGSSDESDNEGADEGEKKKDVSSLATSNNTTAAPITTNS